MSLNNLKPAPGATHNSKRVGRGEGSGKGGHSARGLNGAKSRSGHSTKIGFEGGQMPLQRRVPKFGFKNINRVEYRAINLSTLQKLAEEKNMTEFNFDVFVQSGLAGKNDLVKILGRGEIKAAVKVAAHKFSKTALDQIVKAGGEAITL